VRNNVVTDGRIEIRFGTEVYRGNYVEDLGVDEGHINDALIAQPARFVFWAKLSAIARVIHEQAKLELEKYDAQLYTFKRNEKESAGEKVTERQLETMIIQDVHHQERVTAVLRAKLQYDHLDSVKEAFLQRSQMLMSVSANLRQEWETSLSLKAHTTGRSGESVGFKQVLEKSASPKADAIRKGLEK
jgi:hypothetical protein